MKQGNIILVLFQREPSKTRLPVSLKTQFAMAGRQRTLNDDPFLRSFFPDELRIASEFLSIWFPFLSRGLCHSCKKNLADRIQMIDPEAVHNEYPMKQCDSFPVPESMCMNGCSGNHDNCNSHYGGGCKEGMECEDLNDTEDTNSLGSWKDGAYGSPDHVNEVSMKASLSGKLKDTLPGGSTSCTFSSPVSVGRQKVKTSWADMAQEDEFEVDEESKSTGSGSLFVSGNGLAVDLTAEKVSMPKAELSRELREHIRFHNVKRKKNFVCFEKVNGKNVNILAGLELHTGVFSAAEQLRIVNYVETLQEMGKSGQLKERTYTAPQKWMRGKGRVTIQFGCCYNYATDKIGNPPGILRDRGAVDPIPQLFKVMIRRLVKWHVMPPNCIPDSCIVNIYDEEDCIPPHIDNHDFVRPFCTVSFLSECDIVFGSNLTVEGPGQFAGAVAIPLPVGSVLVINGNSADVAKHCVPSVHSKRISITFRKMDDSKRPAGYAPEPDLQGIQPLVYEVDRPKRDSRHSTKKQAVWQEKPKGWRSEPRYRGRKPVNW